MNNFKFDYGKKYHYMLKYIVMAIPVLLLVLSFLFPTKQINNNYSVESETTINYKYQTNDVNSQDDLIVGNIYYLSSIPTNARFDVSYFSFDYITTNYSDSTFYVSSTNAILNYSNSIISIIYDGSNSNGFSRGYIHDMTFVLRNFTNFVAGDSLDYISACPQELIPIENTTITNIINDNSSVISVDEVKVNNTAYLKPLNDFYKLNINSWYDNLLNQMNLNLDNDSTYFIYHIPLYIIYLYIFDIILDLFGMVFRLGHKLISKVGGDY